MGQLARPRRQSLWAPVRHAWFPKANMYSISTTSNSKKPLFVTWPVSRSQWRQNLAICDPNRLTVATETWCLQVAARWGFLKIDSKTVKIHLRKYPPRGHLETPSSWHHSEVIRAHRRPKKHPFDEALWRAGLPHL